MKRTIKVGTVRDVLHVLKNGLDELAANDVLAVIEGAASGELTLEERGFSQPDELGRVQILPLEAIRGELVRLGYIKVAAAIPTWHVTDYWNPNEGDALELLNEQPLSPKAKYFLNYNLNRGFFLPLGKAEVWSDKPLNINLAADWPGWSDVKNSKAPESPAYNILETGSKRYPFAPDLTGPSTPDTYVWQTNVPCEDASFHTACWLNWIESKIGQGIV
jgi:hypothetical protein